MISLDTNILARRLLQNDMSQFKRVEALLAADATYTAPPTVILELVWVLESYDCTRTEILHSLNSLLGLPNFKPKSVEALRYAIGVYASGMDFGDALHLALSAKDEAFATFDKALGKLAVKHAGLPPVQVL